MTLEELIEALKEKKYEDILLEVDAEGYVYKYEEER